MQSDIFKEQLKSINNRFRIQNQKILLLINNASLHFNPDKNEQDTLALSHIKVKFFLPNTTVHLQSIDMEIINSFKAIYK